MFIASYNLCTYSENHKLKQKHLLKSILILIPCTVE